MRLEDWDVRDESVLDLASDHADQLRAEYEADERAKAERRRYERAEWFRALARARLAQAAMHADEVAADVAWARSVLVDGETFEDGLALYCVLHDAKKQSLGRSLGMSEINRLRRAVLVLWPEMSGFNVSTMPTASTGSAA